MTNEQLALLLSLLARSLDDEVDTVEERLPDDFKVAAVCRGVEKPTSRILHDIRCRINSIRNQANSLRYK